MPDWLQYVAPVLTALAGLIVGLRKHRNTTSAQIQEQQNSFMDQLQEERKARGIENDKLSARIDLLYQDKFVSRLYVATLIEWGINGGGPPVPTAPEGYIF